MTDFTALLDCYTIEEILEYNDLTLEDCIAFLVAEKFVSLPDVLPLDLDD